MFAYNSCKMVLELRDIMFGEKSGKKTCLVENVPWKSMKKTEPWHFKMQKDNRYIF